MSKLYYEFPLEEEYEDSDKYEFSRFDIPHFQQIKDWLPKEWDSCNIKETFDGILKDKVESTKMTCYQKTLRTGRKLSFARILITFVPGFRLSEKK